MDCDGLHFPGFSALHYRATSVLKGRGSVSHSPAVRPTSSALLEAPAHAHMCRAVGNLIDLVCLG